MLLSCCFYRYHQSYRQNITMIINNTITTSCWHNSVSVFLDLISLGDFQLVPNITSIIISRLINMRRPLIVIILYDRPLSARVFLKTAFQWHQPVSQGPLSCDLSTFDPAQNPFDIFIFAVQAYFLAA